MHKQFSTLRPLARLVGLGALLTLVVTAQAQSLSARSNGRGTVVYDGRTRTLRTADVSLRRNGDFTIRLGGDLSMTVEGSWSGGTRGRYTLKYDTVNGRNGKGDGTITVDNRDRLQTIYLNGSIGRDGFSLSFNGSRPDGGFGGSGGSGGSSNGDRFESFRESKRGRGGLDYERRMKDIDFADVYLRRDGSFEISFRGDARFKVLGSWSWRGNDISLRIDDALGDKLATGSGTLYVSRDRRSFWKIEMSGSAKDRRFNVGFNE